MMKKLLLLPLILLAACGGGNKPKETAPAILGAPFFAGKFVYFADAAVLTDCATAVRLPVSMTGAFIDAQNAYLALEPQMGEAIFVEFRGHIGQQPRMEGEGMERAFVIDSLIGFDRQRDCEAEWLLPGVYEGNGDVRRVLRLQPDYTFAETIFSAEPDMPVLMQTGSWWRNSNLELILRAEDADSTTRSFEIIPARESLVRNDGKNPLVFKKVYL